MATAKWVYRDEMKKTNHINFGQSRLLGGAESTNAKKGLSLLTGTRNTLLEAISKRESKSEDVLKAFEEYFAHIKGLIDPSSSDDMTEVVEPKPETLEEAVRKSEAKEEDVPTPEDEPVKKDDQSSKDETEQENEEDKLKKEVMGTDMAKGRPVQRVRGAITYKWTDTVSGSLTENSSPQVEINHMLLNCALWMLHNASYVAHETEFMPAEEKDAAKQVLEIMKKAASLTTFLEDRLSHSNIYEPNTDFDPRVVKARNLQALGEGQEVIVDVCRKEKPRLLTSKIAHDTCLLFETAADELKSLNPKLLVGLRHYLRFKGLFYKAYAKIFYAEHLHEQEEKASDACRLAMDSAGLISEAQVEAQAMYKALKSKSGIRPPSEHKLFVMIQKYIVSVGDKIKREMTMIYKVKPAEHAPPLPDPQRIFQANAFVEPPRAEVWSQGYINAKKVYEKGQNPDADKASGDMAEARSRAWQQRTNASNACSIQ